MQKARNTRSSDKKWGEWMKDERDRAKIQANKLAKTLGETAPTISNWEKSKRRPSYDRALAWAEALHPGDEDFAWLAKTKIGYIPVEFDEFLDPQKVYTHRLTQLLAYSRDTRLNLEAVVESEIERFAHVWKECFSIRLQLFENKNYADALSKSEEIIYSKTRKHKSIEPRALAYLLDIAGNSNFHLGQLSNSLEQLDEAILIGNAIYKDLQELQSNHELLRSWMIWLAHCYDHYGDVLRVVGDYDQARKMCAESEKLFEESGDVLGQIRARRKFALVDLVRGGGMQRAIEICIDSLRLLEEHRENPYSLYERAKTLCTLGWAYNISGQTVKALEAHKEAEFVWKDKTGRANDYELMKVYRYLGDDYEQASPPQYDRAEDYYRKALGLAEKLEIVNRQEADHELGMIYLGLGKIETHNFAEELAKHYFKKAIDMFRTSESKYTDRVRAGLILRNKAKLHALLKEKDVSLNYTKEAVKLLGSVKANGYAAAAQLDVADFAIRLNDKPLFNAYLQKAEELLKTPESNPPLDDQVVFQKYQQRYEVLKERRIALS